MRNGTIALTLIILSSGPFSGLSHAASGDAWAEFAKLVGDQCIAAAADSIEDPKAVVDPFGSENYGLAIVSGKAKGADTTISRICVMDKMSQTVQLGGEIPADQVTVGE